MDRTTLFAATLAILWLLSCGGSEPPPPEPPPTPVYQPPPPPPPEPPPPEPETPPMVLELKGVLGEIQAKVDEILGLRFTEWRGRFGQVKALVQRAQSYEGEVPQSAQTIQEMFGHLRNIEDALRAGQRRRAQLHLENIRDKARTLDDSLGPAPAAAPEGTGGEEAEAEEPAAAW